MLFTVALFRRNEGPSLADMMDPGHDIDPEQLPLEDVVNIVIGEAAYQYICQYYEPTLLILMLNDPAEQLKAFLEQAISKKFAAYYSHLKSLADENQDITESDEQESTQLLAELIEELDRLKKAALIIEISCYTLLKKYLDLNFDDASQLLAIITCPKKSDILSFRAHTRWYFNVHIKLEVFISHALQRLCAPHLCDPNLKNKIKRLINKGRELQRDPPPGIAALTERVYDFQDSGFRGATLVASFESQRKLKFDNHNGVFTHQLLMQLWPDIIGK